MPETCQAGHITSNAILFGAFQFFARFADQEVARLGTEERYFVGSGINRLQRRRPEPPFQTTPRASPRHEFADRGLIDFAHDAEASGLAFGGFGPWRHRKLLS